MHSEFERQWRLARTHENEGNLTAAKTIYESLLQADPERLYVRLRLSAIEQAFGNYGASREHALRSAESVRHDRWKDLAVVSRRLLTFDERAAVFDLIMGVDWAHPEIVKSSAILSQHLWLTDHVAEALRLIEVASARAQDSHVLVYSKANALRYFGQMEQATAAYERCLDLEPNYAYAHWSLAYHQKATPPGSRIDRIRRAQATFPADAPEQPYFHYALFKEYDDAAETDLAWASLHAGASAKRRSIRYDSALEEEGFAALQQTVTSDFIRGNQPEGSSDRGSIFIVGMPRTGTTLLERILGSHSQVTPGGELNDFNSALCLASDRFLESSITTTVVNQLRDIDYAKVGRTYLERTNAKADGKNYLVDKNPANFAYAGYIAKALPGAKIVCLRRSPMDACLSNLKELFSSEAYGYSYDLEELADHYIRFSRLCQYWQQVMPDQFHVVDYECLVTNPSNTIERVMDFCGMPFEPECVDITRNTAPVSTASSSQVRQPIHARGVDAWQKYAKNLEPLRARIEEAFPALR